MLIIGNGESRLGIDLNSIADCKIGCNAIFRDFRVDHIICVDKRMVAEALNSKANFQSLVYTRLDWFDRFHGFLHLRTVPDLPYKGDTRPDEPFQWGSGPYAVLLGAQLAKTNETIKLIGFDLYSSTGKTNNVYKDTENYNASDKRAVDPRYWIYQIGKIFECYPEKSFLIYTEDDWIIPESWNKSNVMVDKISNIV
jgi:hypothetical protein